MSLAGERYDDAKALFVAAVERPRSERDEFVATRCAGDPELRDLVLRLVRAHDVDDVPTETDIASLDASVFDVPDYRLLRAIGSGAAGIVFAAEHLETGSPVAVKILRPELVTATSSARAKREAHILERLDHPGIARLIGSGDAATPWGARPYSVLELVEGESLRSWWQRATLPERFAMLADICDAVQAAHDVDVVHRDLKPSNVLVDTSGRPKVLDFGIAKLLDEPSTTISGSTRSGELVGTLAYASPEQVAGRRAAIGPAADVYSLGAILFEMVAGRPPHDLDRLSILDAVRTVASEDPPRLRRLVKDVSPALDAVVRRALARRPQDRYPTARALGVDLRCLADGAAPLARRRVLRRRRAVAVALALVAVATSTRIGTRASARDAATARAAPRCPEPVPDAWLSQPAPWLPQLDHVDGYWVEQVMWIDADRYERSACGDTRRRPRRMPLPPLAIAAQAWRLGELEQAIAEYEAAVQGSRSGESAEPRAVGPRGAGVGATQLFRIRLAYLLMFAGAPGRAEVILRGVVEDDRSSPGASRAGVQKRLLNLAHYARILAACGRHDEARSCIDEALTAREADGPTYVVAEVELAAALVAWARGDREQAHDHALRARALLDAMVVPEHPLAQRAADMVARTDG